MLAMIISK